MPLDLKTKWTMIKKKNSIVKCELYIVFKLTLLQPNLVITISNSYLR